MDNVPAFLIDSNFDEFSAESVYVPPAKAKDLEETVRIPRFAILKELLKLLKGAVQSKRCETTVGGISSCLKVQVSGLKERGMKVELCGSSCGSFDTEAEAVESASKELIRSLKECFEFEVDDVNWREKNDSKLKIAELEDHIEKLIEENSRLKEFVTAVVDGWAFSLRLADSVYKMSDTTCLCIRSESISDERGDRMVATIEALRDHAKFVWREGVNSFDCVLITGSSVYEP